MFSRTVVTPALSATRPVLCALAGVASAVVACAAVATPPQAEVFFASNHSDLKFDYLAGTTAQNGNQIYIATYAALDGTYQITYYLNVDHTTNPQVSVSGTITVENKTTDQTIPFEVGANIPICPEIDGGSLIGGSALLTLTTVGPGTVSCDRDGEPILDCLADGHGIESLFYCPTTLTSTGSSTISYSGTFGLPGPSEAGPKTIGTIGAREHFLLTPKDKLAMQLTFYYKDPNGVTPPDTCNGDLDGDGVIGATDLAIFFAEWGETNFCPSAMPSDLNDDGEVNSIDLLIILSGWGTCE